MKVIAVSRDLINKGLTYNAKVKIEDVATYLKKVGPSLNEHGKETIIKCALFVAAADGNVDDSELALISKMAQSMEMSSSHLKGIISDLFESKENLL